jgi:hypothetical protein
MPHSAPYLSSNFGPVSQGSGHSVISVSPTVAETDDGDSRRLTESWDAHCVCCGRTFQATEDDCEPMCARCEFESDDFDV